MFIRKNKNRNNSISVQVISKNRGRYKVEKTLGTGRTEEEIELLYLRRILWKRAKQYIQEKEGTISLFVNREDALIESYLSSIKNAQIQVIGPELIFGRIYDSIGFGDLGEELFRHLVITRLYHPGSKLKTIDYLYRFMGIKKNVDEIYRFMDKISTSLKGKIEEIAFDHTKEMVGEKISSEP